MTNKEKIKSLIRIDSLGEVQAQYLIKIGIETPEQLITDDIEDIFIKLKKLKETDTNLNYQISKTTITKWINSAETKEYLYSLSKQRYESIIERTFDELLHLYIFENIDVKDIYLDNFNFKIGNKTLLKYNETFEDLSKVRSNNTKIKKILSKKHKQKKDLLKKYSKFFEKQLPYEEFKKFYGKDNYDRQCKYCKIKESDIAELLKNEKIKTKRIYSRGKHMEVDRTESNGKYEIKNIKLCCYWCNNAKTDEFDGDDFITIGNAIEEIWKKRLNE